MQRKAAHTFFLSSYFFGHRLHMAFLMHTDIWQRMVIALLHTERTVLVFQRRTLLNLFPHINLSRVLSLPHVACAQTMINMPLLPCDKILQIILPAYLQLQSPYYFQKVVWSLSFDYFFPGSTLYVPCVTSSFMHPFFFSFSPLSGFEYGNTVWANMEVTVCSAEEAFHQLFTTGHPVMMSLAFAFFFSLSLLLKYPPIQ